MQKIFFSSVAYLYSLSTCIYLVLNVRNLYKTSRIYSLRSLPVKKPIKTCVYSQGFNSFTRMGSKVMPLANFHRNCWREDKTHALYVFSILSPFNRCINCTCRHTISREIYFCTNPTHRRLSKMVGISVENEIEIRAYIKTRALLRRGSADIYADICTVYVSNSMSFSTVCRQIRDRSVQA